LWQPLSLFGFNLSTSVVAGGLQQPSKAALLFLPNNKNEMKCCVQQGRRDRGGKNVVLMICVIYASS
jgi:hypothetical protein